MPFCKMAKIFHTLPVPGNKVFPIKNNDNIHYIYIICYIYIIYSGTYIISNITNITILIITFIVVYLNDNPLYPIIIPSFIHSPPGQRLCH